MAILREFGTELHDLFDIIVDFVHRFDITFTTAHAHAKRYLSVWNRYLIMQTAILLTCSDGQDGGTENTVEYARKNGCKVCLISVVRKEYASH